MLPAGIVLLGMIHALVYSWIRGALGSGGVSRGMRFGVVAWALMVPWFEFFLPWSAMHEPTLLVLLEVVLWLCVLLVVGIVIAAVYDRSDRRTAG